MSHPVLLMCGSELRLISSDTISRLFLYRLAKCSFSADVAGQVTAGMEAYWQAAGLDACNAVRTDTVCAIEWIRAWIGLSSDAQDR